MTLLQHEIDAIADRILAHISGKLAELVRSTIREELKMTDQAITDLTNSVNNAIAEFSTLITTVQSEQSALAAALNASGASNDPLIEAQVTRLNTAVAAAAQFVATLQPSSTNSPAPDSPALAPAAPAAPSA